MALAGEIKVEFLDDGTFKINASKATADGGSVEVAEALKQLAAEVGGDWAEEKHAPGVRHTHSNRTHDHHRH